MHEKNYIIKKKNIKIVLWKKILKINKNYIKNFKIILEIKNIFFKKNILILNALNSSQHTIGFYKNNIKNIGWWNQIIRTFYKYKIINIGSINSSYGSTNSNSKLVLIYKKNNNNFIKICYKKILKIKINILKKLKIKKFYIIIGGSIGGIKSFIFNIIYPKKVNIILSIAFGKISKYEKLSKNNNQKSLKENIKIKTINYDFKKLKNLKMIREINNIIYFSKKDLKNKKKKIKKNLIFIKYKKNIFKYLSYKTKKFIKYFNIIFYIFLTNLKNKIFRINFKILKKKKYIILIFKDDKKFKKNYSIKIIKYFLKIKKNINVKIINIYKSHDSFLIKNLKYLNFVNKIRGDKIRTYNFLIPNQTR